MKDLEDLRRSRRCLAILALALVAYWPTLRVGFLWDDHVMIESNPALREWSGRALTHDFTTDVFDGHGDPYYRPAQTLLNRMDYSIWGLRPFGYHLTNWLGHAANALLLQELVIALGFGNLVALLVGCLFAVNPMPVEQLIIIAGRAEIFGLTFTLISLLFLLREDAESWALGYAAYALALLFKESALITPFLLAILYLYRKVPRSAYWRLLPHGVLAIPYLMLRYHAVGPLISHATIGYISKFFFEAYAQVLLIYARLILMPWNLHSHRMMPNLTHFWPLLDMFFVGLAIYLIRRKSRWGLLGFAWFVIMLLPKTPIMIYGNFMLDHWAYPASFGIILPLAVVYAKLWQGRKNPFSYWTGMTFFPLVIFWALLVHLNVALRGTDEKMYRWALHFTQSHPIQFNLGALLVEQGRPMEAIPYFENVRADYPKDVNNIYALAQAYWQTGHPKIAIRLLEGIQMICPPARQTLFMMKASRRSKP